MAERKKREKKTAEAPAKAPPRTRRKTPEAPAETPAPRPRARKTAAPAEASAKKPPRARRAPAVPAEAPAEAPAPLPEAPAAFRAPPPADWPPLPAVTGQDHLVAVPIDARDVLLYWELTAEGLNRARAGLAEAERPSELILRLYVLGPGGETDVRDAAVGAWLGRRRFSFDRAGLRLTAAVGFRAGDGFVGVARSNPVQLPQPGPGGEPPRFVDAAGARQPAPADVDGEALRRLSAAEVVR
jgi:hypothetical protein